MNKCAETENLLNDLDAKVRLDPFAVCRRPKQKVCILHSRIVSTENPGVARSGPVTRDTACAPTEQMS